MTQRIEGPGPPVLIIDRSASKCGACGRDANPHDEIHRDVIGYNPVPNGGCHVRWTQVSTFYTGAEQEAAVREMRPDLEWAGLGVGSLFPSAACGARATFWPDVEACEATCSLPSGHLQKEHRDKTLGVWDPDELLTVERVAPVDEDKV